MKQVLSIIILGMLFVCGCESYYHVTDPSTDKDYYTKEVKKLGSGAVKIINERNGSTVTLQNSEIKKIKKQEFEQGVYGN